MVDTEKIEEARAVNNKGVGLLAVWASAVLAMITVYVIFQFTGPLIGQLFYEMNNLVSTGAITMDPNWETTYYSTQATLQTIFSFTFIALFISLVVFIVVQSARRRTDEYEEGEL